jgi:hypothetical protein
MNILGIAYLRVPPATEGFSSFRIENKTWALKRTLVPLVVQRLLGPAPTAWDLIRCGRTCLGAFLCNCKDAGRGMLKCLSNNHLGDFLRETHLLPGIFGYSALIQAGRHVVHNVGHSMSHDDQ